MIGGALFVLPGYALLVLFESWLDFDFDEILCASVGLSIATVPLVLYFTTYLGMRLTSERIIFLLLIAGGVCIRDWWRRFSTWWKRTDRKINPIRLLLGFVFFLTLGAQIWIVRDIAYPLWTDSYHHTVITQLISDTGKIPSSYKPYAPIERFTYHFGFHTISAWFHWLSGIPIPRSVVLMGQVINALAVLTCYLLVVRLLRSHLAALIAAWVVGLVSHMPTLFVNWGRYTQLSGQVLLPVLMVMTTNALEPQRPKPTRWILTGIGAAGLFLVHMRVFLFYVMFASLLFAFKFLEAFRKRSHKEMLNLLMGSAVTGSIVLFLIFPWLHRFFRGFGSVVLQEISKGYQAQRDQSYFAWNLRYLFDYGMQRDLLFLAGIGGVLGIVRHERNVYLVMIWLMGMFIAANCYIVGLTPLVSNLIVIILVYLPCAVLIGYFVNWLIKQITKWVQKRGYRMCIMQLIIGSFMLISMWGAWYKNQLIKPQNGFVQPADIDAMSWIRQNVSQDALFHINGRFWTPTVAHGLDAGYWIPLLAQRKTTIPLEPYGSDGSAEYIDFINQRARELFLADTPEYLWQAMRKYNVTHLYLGKRQTSLHAEFFLSASMYFRPVYSKEGVWIFEVLRPSQLKDTSELSAFCACWDQGHVKKA